MTPLDAIWHLANFFAPAAGLASIAALLAKFLWRRSLSGISWWRLGRWAWACGTLISITGLAVFGRDGKMATYAAMVAGCALTLWWIGFVRRGR